MGAHYVGRFSSIRRVGNTWRVRVLHVSDLHVSAGEDFGQRQVIGAFLDDLKTQAKERPFDLVVFSGDLANHGQADEFRLGHDLFVTPTLDAVGLALDRFIIVPGNHDVDRKEINQFEDLGLAHLLTDEGAVNALLADQDKLDSALRRLRPWEAYRDALPRAAKAGSLAHVYRFEIDSVDVGVAGLNSAWRCAGDSDHRSLLIGENQIVSGLDAIRECAVKVVVAHHPLDWYAPFDESVVRRELEKAATLFLSGHEHAAEPSFEARRRGATIYSRGGCLYEDSDYANAYSIIDYDLETGEVDINLRSWWSGRGVFDVATNLAKDGRFSFPPLEVGKSLTHPPFNEVRQALAQTAQFSGVGVHDRLDPSTGLLEDVLVAPRFLPLPYKDAIAAKRVDDDLRVGSVDPWSEEGDVQDGLIVSGEPGSGITASLLWLLDDSYKADPTLLPVAITYDPKFSERGIERELVRAAKLAGWTGAKDSLPPLQIAVDDVTTSGRGLSVLVDFFKRNRQHRFVVGCYQHDQAEVASVLDTAGLRATNLFLGPFGRGQLRKLIEKIAGPSTDLIGPIYQVVYAQDLPRTPFLLSTLVVVVAETNPSDLVSVNASALLQKYVDLLLGRDETGDDEALAMDYRRREYLLGSFAAMLVDRGVASIPRLDAEKYLVGWFENRGWGSAFSPGRILESLIHRRVLAQDPSGLVGFRQPALQHLFAAKWMLEDEVFRKKMLADPAGNSEPISHAAALSRNNKEFIAASEGHLKTTLQECEELISSARLDAVTSDDGWERLAPNPRQLERQLSSDPPPKINESDRDQRLDAWDEQRDAQTSAAEPAPSDEDKLFRAVDLATSVLRSSELVDDVALKVEAMRLIISGWGAVAGLAATAELEEPLAAFVDANGDELADHAEAMGDLTRVVRLMMLVGVLMEVEEQLGTLHLTGVVDELLLDEELMSESASALLLTLLQFNSKGSRAHQQLRALWEAQGTNPMVGRLVLIWAHWAYDYEPDRRAREPLERLIIDIYLSSEPAQDRGERGRIAGKLQTLRLKRLSRAKHREEFDALDAEDDDVIDVEPVAQGGTAAI